MYKVEKLDNLGRGIVYVNNKITFVSNTLPGEEIDIKITKEKSKYNEAIVIKYYKQSNKRVDSKCPYYRECGGCDLLHFSYDGTIDFKKNKVKDILYKYASLDINVDIIENKNKYNYRNKISLKVIDGNYGYYKNNTHELVSINNCLLAEDNINSFLKDIRKININNGELIIRNNYNNELLIIINTKEKVNIDVDYLKDNYKIAGIVVNNKKYYNDDFFIEMINNRIFKVSYDSFFQVNRYICSKLFDIVSNNVREDEIVLDLYSGVGTLGINIANKVKKVYGIEIVRNAVINATYNTKINKINNAYYMLGDVGSTVNKINDKIDTIIVDPPRIGLDKNTKSNILNSDAKKIIYISCNPMTLARDLKDISEIYMVKKVWVLDMFSYTEHCESITVLERR